MPKQPPADKSAAIQALADSHAFTAEQKALLFAAFGQQPTPTLDTPEDSENPARPVKDTTHPDTPDTKEEPKK